MNQIGQYATLLGASWLLSRLVIGDFLIAMLIVGVVGYLTVKAFEYVIGD